MSIFGGQYYTHSKRAPRSILKHSKNLMVKLDSPIEFGQVVIIDFQKLEKNNDAEHF